MTLDFLPSPDFPSNTVTDGQFLYRALGSFWTSLFKDQNALKGYTLGMAEELIQSYYNLVSVVKQYSVKEINILHKEKWKPLTIKKSEFNALTVQAGDELVFGFQPTSNVLYSNKLFRVGFPKESSNAYSFKPAYKLVKFGALANRIISPSLVLLPGVDVIFKDDILLFNKNIFEEPALFKAKLITEQGTQATYVDINGNTVDDEFVVLWMYSSEQDDEELYNSFGVLFDLKLDSSANYKELLKALMNLAVEGSTVTALNKALAALMAVPIIIEPSEIVEDIYDFGSYTYVITDKNTYRTPSEYQLAASVRINKVLHAGDILTDNLKIYDPVISTSWWKNEVKANKLGFSSHVFAADSSKQLFFENTASVISYIKQSDRIVFPVLGDAVDVQAFQDYINIPKNKSAILKALNISTSQSSSLAINPLDFVFNHIFKNNTLFVRVNFYNDEQLNRFFSLISTIQKYLPPHVYILMYVDIQFNADEINNLNSCLKIPAYGNAIFSADGSNSSGNRPGTFDDDTKMYYKDYANRMFCIAKGPLKNGQPLHADGSLKYSSIDNLDTIYVNNVGNIEGNLGTGIKCGLLRTEIPTSVQPPGESSPRLPSNREIPTILLIDF